MKKVAEFFKKLMHLSVTFAVFYAMFGYPKYFFTGLIVIIVLAMVYMLISFKQVYWYLEKEYANGNNVLNEASQDNSELAKATFRWNILAQKFYEWSLNSEYLKRQAAMNQENSMPSTCMMIFNISHEDMLTITIPEIRAKWKTIAKEFHPDKFQDAEEKAKAEKKFIRLTGCKDTLIKIIKTRSTNV